jgi:hypothetical protein
MTERLGDCEELDQPWPWGPAEEYVNLYEGFIIGAIEEEPALPEGLSSEDLAFIKGQREFIEFQADNFLWGDTQDALDAYRALKEIQGLPEPGETT